MKVADKGFMGTAAAAFLLAAGSILTTGQATAATSTVTVDFGNRATSHAIPGNWLGAGAGGTLKSNSAPLLNQANLNYTRFHALIEQTFRTTTANWGTIDAEVATAQAAGMHVILEMTFVPTRMLPNPNPCSGSSAAYAPPSASNLSGFAALNAAYVHHMDQKFPGVVTDYEIWNEPDGGGLCTGVNNQSSKLNAYMTIYAAVAPAIRSAAAQDGASVRVGGPALGSPGYSESTWIPKLLSDTRTRNYVDFISYHYYASSPTDASHHMTWSGTGGTPSLYGKTQASGSGMAGRYSGIAKLVAQGSQPNASSTPIYVDEYNSDWGFTLDCCRNSYTYAPLWEGVVFTDLLNTVYSGAPNVPAKLLYYAVSNPPFCIEGKIDANMDCGYATGTPQAYPQYYALQLFESRSYLGLVDGGHVAKSAYTGISTLLVSGVYNNYGDSVVIVNPTGTSYSNVSVLAVNSGYSGPHATLHLLNSSNPTITTETTGVSAVSGGYQTSVTVPAYSVVTVTFQ